MNLYDFIAIIFYVIFGTCVITLIVAFRKEIKVLLKRLALLTRTYSCWKRFKALFVLKSEQELATQTIKINYEIYNPTTGMIDDR